MLLSRPVPACALLLAAAASAAFAEKPPRTFANPINIEYRFSLDAPSRREAADPVIVLFGDDYYLFASKSGGYWHSKDLAGWTFVKPEGLPIEAYAPGIMAYQGALYYTACDIGLYKTTDPKAGKWEYIGQPFKVGDPDLFADDDGRVYLYYGLSYNGAISGVELDPKNGFQKLGEAFECFRSNFAEHGWERKGDANLGGVADGKFQEGPWIEGSWMTKHNGVYYLQYAAPGTEFKTYSDGVYTAKTPRGPFTYAPNSPFSHKPAGFMGGAGHSATFRDKQGRYWHISTTVISIKHMFERRLGLFPVEFDSDGVMHALTLFGDYPQLLPALQKDGVDPLAAWMLLSYGKKAQASSSLDTFGPDKAFDEDIKTHWSARTANQGEWLMVDLGKPCRIDAVQVNLAEHEATALGRGAQLHARYVLEASTDNASWVELADRSASTQDTTHDYLELPQPLQMRYVRLRNSEAAGGGPFSVRDLRVFGNAGGKAPAAAPRFDVFRRQEDGRNAVVRWDPAPDAEGYLVRYGIAPGKLYQNYEVRGQREISLHGLNAGVDYYFSVDAFNASGRTAGQKLVAAPAPKH
jgi:xylan 1,4-beta-xylosidase